MHHYSQSSTYSPADKSALERLEHERKAMYHHVVSFIKLSVASVVLILFLMAVFLI